MQFMNSSKRATQRGFTMIELAFVIAIIAVLAGVYLFSDSGSRGKAVTLLATMTETGNGLMKLKADTGCHTNRIDALFNRDVLVDASTSYCGVAMNGQWRGPYVKRFDVDASQRMRINKIASNATITIGRETAGLGQQYFLRVEGIPNELVRWTIAECNGVSLDSTSTLPTTFTNTKCRAVVNVTGETGRIDYLFDETT